MSNDTMSAPDVQHEKVDEFFVYCSNTFFDVNFSTKYRHWFIIPSVIIIAVLSLMEKRKSLKPDLFGGRPGLASPLSFLDEPSNRFGIMVVFGSVTATMIQTTQQSFGLNWPTWAKIFIIFLMCIETSLICYPLFACMTSSHKGVGAVTGLLYSIGWFIFEFFVTIQLGRCFTRFTRSDLNVNIAAHTVIQELPVVICTFLTMIKFAFKLYKCISKGQYGAEQKVSRMCRNYHKTYVKALLYRHKFKEIHGQMKLKERLICMIVRPVPGFRFPVTIISTAFMSGVMLYMVGLFCAEYMEIKTKLYFDNDFMPFLKQLTAANVIATLITMLCGIRNIYLFLMNYRRDILLLYRGDKSFIPGTVMTPATHLTLGSGMQFMGTAIAGMLWGTVSCFLVLFVPMALMFTIINILLDKNKFNEFFKELQWLIYPVCMIVIFQLKALLTRRFFIQPKIHTWDKYKPLAVNNRKIYDIFSFFMLFLNLTIGIISFLKRIILGAIMGVFLLPRMDRSLLLRGYEKMDKCYVNYIGMILVDVTHNHPVMRVFCQLITESIEHKRNRQPLPPVENSTYPCNNNPYPVPSKECNSIAKRRWWLAYTLLRNPCLIPSRVCTIPANHLHEENATVESVYINIESIKKDEDQSADTWGITCKCNTNRTFTIPPNFTTNILLFIVFLSILLVYAGISILWKSLLSSFSKILEL